MARRPKMDSHWGSCLCLAWLADGTFVAHKTVHCMFTTFPNILSSIGTGLVPFLAVSLVDYSTTLACNMSPDRKFLPSVEANNLLDDSHLGVAGVGTQSAHDIRTLKKPIWFLPSRSPTGGSW